MIFRKSWPRFALESAIEYNIKHSGLSGGRCINIGCGTSGRYKELLSTFDTDGVDTSTMMAGFIWKPAKGLSICPNMKQVTDEDDTFAIDFQLKF